MASGGSVRTSSSTVDDFGTAGITGRPGRGSIGPAPRASSFPRTRQASPPAPIRISAAPTASIAPRLFFFAAAFSEPGVVDRWTVGPASVTPPASQLVRSCAMRDAVA